MENAIEEEFKAHVDVLFQTVSNERSRIITVIDAFIRCFQNGNKVLLCGNGGSAADAQHVAAEFVNRFRFDRSALAAIALTTDSSILTCIGNDSSFENIFSRQVESIGLKNDILVGISTSGNSKNVLRALKVARAKGLITIGFTGERGKETMEGDCDYCLVAAASDTARIQECHEFVWHVICGLVEERLFK